MEYLIRCPDKKTGTLVRVSVEKGKVISATPSFAWAVGGGMHAVLSHCAKRKIRWERLRPRLAGQMELSL